MLKIFTLESGKFDDRNISYLQLPSSKRLSTNPQQRSLSSSHHTLQRASPLRNDTLSSSLLSNSTPYIVNEKNSVQYQTIVCSTVHTTNIKLLQILRWREYEIVLKDRIRELIGYPNSESDNNELNCQGEILKLLPNLLDALFQIASHLPKHQKEVFEAIVYLIRLCEEPKQCRHKQVLEEYVHKLHCPQAHTWLLPNLIWFVKKRGQEP
uniref:Dedicator of cytokinesis TPR repeats region domain-containing protein n=1 Tax=Ditylenchus dipsaci TaxID=166011 RepID=A0A915DZ71_9BILA